jgi:antitoxin component YwqK of YwqJK toxin-antitoxin module
MPQPPIRRTRTAAILLVLALLGLVVSQVLRRTENSDPRQKGEGPKLVERPATAEISKKDLQWNSGESRFYYQGAAFTGITTDFHKNGKLRLRWGMADGKMHGLVEEFNDKGIQVTSKLYKNGLRHGETRYYFPEGQLMKVVQYENDVEAGPEQLFNRDGTPLIHQP